MAVTEGVPYVSNSAPRRRPPENEGVRTSRRRAAVRFRAGSFLSAGLPQSGRRLAGVLDVSVDCLSSLSGRRLGTRSCARVTTRWEVRAGGEKNPFGHIMFKIFTSIFSTYVTLMILVWQTAFPRGGNLSHGKGKAVQFFLHIFGFLPKFLTI